MTEKKIDFKVDYSKLNIISEHNTKEPRYPMVLSVPHSGRVFPQEFLDRVDVSLNELRSNEDPFVDELVMEASNLGIPMVALNIGRASTSTGTRSKSTRQCFITTPNRK